MMLNIYAHMYICVCLHIYMYFFSHLANEKNLGEEKNIFLCSVHKYMISVVYICIHVETNVIDTKCLHFEMESAIMHYQQTLDAKIRRS